MNREIQLEIDRTINEVFDELPGSSYLALRRLRWNESSPFRLDIRKWYTNSEGQEIAGKGVSFMTEEGPNNLIVALMKHGYGDTEKTIEALKNREDFIPVAIKALASQDVDQEIKEHFSGPEYEEYLKEAAGEGETFYDPKELLGGEE